MNAAAPEAFQMPAEWEPHEAVWIAWPHNRDDWPGKFDAIPWVYAEIVRCLHHSEPVHILVNGPAGERRARVILGNLDLDWQRIAFHRVPTDRVWTRDSLSPFVLDKDGRVGVVKWQFNAWAKYDDWRRDNDAAARIMNRRSELRFWMSACREGRGVVLEGGSIDVNGRGCLLTTEECLLSEVQQRNPGFTRRDYEGLFAEYLGVKKVLWLGRGVAGDDTHGHVDDLARFVGPRTVVTAVEDDPRDENYQPLQENLERLRGMTDLDGGRLEVVKLPMPAPLTFAGRRLPASYANFYIANDRVLAPTFNDPADRVALGVLAELFPGRTVVGVHAVDLVWGLGTLHCLTQQQPRGGGEPGA
jgi:agmatine deiminase